MQVFRADFDVKGSIILQEQSPTLSLHTYDRRHEIVLRNAKVDAQGHVPLLDVSVIGPCDSIDAAVRSSQEILASGLDVLSYATHGKFEILQCRRVMDWEPSKKSRELLAMQSFDADYPPLPALHPVLMDTANAITAADVPGYVVRALHQFRLGILNRQSQDQFQQFWMALETVAEGSKEPVRVAIQCPKCRGALRCNECQTEPTRRPVASEAIRDLLRMVAKDEGEEIFERLIAVRHHIFHGRSVASIESDLGRSLTDLVNEAAWTAWHAIGLKIPATQSKLTFVQRDDFENLILRGRFRLVFEHEGLSDHPTEDQIPSPDISVRSRLGPLPSHDPDDGA